MTEILTESFCERCGTRYTFESGAPRKARLRNIRTLGRGLRNFVLSDDSSLDEALAAARSDAEREMTSMQLDAFHKTFNFCMSCRQYTCANCWNEPEGRCLSCAPLEFAEPPAIEAVDPDRLLRFMGTPDEAEDHVHVAATHDEPAWPAASLPDAVVAETSLQVAAGLEAALDAPAQASAAVGADAVDEPDAAVAADETAPSTMDLVDERVAPDADEAPLQATAAFDAEADASADIELETAALGGLAPGQSLDDAIAAYEATLAAEEEARRAPETEATDALAAAAATERAAQEHHPVAAPIAGSDEWDSEAAEGAAVEGAAVDAAAAEQPEASPALADEAEVEEPISTAEPEAPAVEAAAEPEASDGAAAAPARPDDVVVQPTWPVAAPAEAPKADERPLPTAPGPSDGAPPAWPTGPRWPTAITARPTTSSPQAPAAQGEADPLAALMARSSTDAMWAASAQDVLRASTPARPAAPAAAANPTVQPCVNCGISLSATARFCRRCGTPQG